MIPKYVSNKHILLAIEEIDGEGVPPRRVARKFQLKYDKKLYPAKYVVGRAVYFATGKELNPELYSGGREVNRFLNSRGFIVIGSSGKIMQNARRHFIPHPGFKKMPIENHYERCSECKNRIHEMLRAIYGKHGVVRTEHKIAISQRLENYHGSLYYKALSKIYKALEEYRGHYSYAKKRTLNPSDVFIDPPGFIVELDESQHFTMPRMIALENYPADLEIGYDRQAYLRRCRELSRNDSRPAHRDEQRAWYDTLRDFAPVISSTVKEPTKRIWLGGYKWCNLDPSSKKDINKFKQIAGLSDHTSTKKYPQTSRSTKAIALSETARRDIRFMEFYLQDIRLLYLRWITDTGFRPPNTKLAGMESKGLCEVIHSPNGNAFTLSPCGLGSAYSGGGKGSVKIPVGCYPNNVELHEQTVQVKIELTAAMGRVRNALCALLNCGDRSSLWGLLQDLYWIKLGIHEFAFDCSYLDKDKTSGVRGILINSLRFGRDLRECHSDFRVSNEDLNKFITYLRWNKYACCSFDSGPVAIARDNGFTFSDFAEHRRLFTTPPLLGASLTKMRAYAKSALSKHYDLILCYDESFASGNTYSNWRSNLDKYKAIVGDAYKRLYVYRSSSLGR